MQLKKTPAYKLTGMDKPDPYNETMIFKTREMAEFMQKHLGGFIRQTFIHTKIETGV